MKHIARSLLFCCLLGAGSTQAATPDTTHMARNGLLTRVTGTGIEVYARPDAVGADYFCAAAEIAKTKLDAPDRAWLEITRALPIRQGTAGRDSVGFTLTPPGPAPAPHRVILWPYRTGANLKVWVALSHCGDGPGKRDN